MIDTKYSSQYAYLPILSLSPSEMGALEELPGKDKDIILPVIPLKGWGISKKLDNSINRIKKAIGERKWVASIDKGFLSENKTFIFTGNYPREVFYELELLLSSSNGYHNWCSFIESMSDVIPCLLLDDKKEVEAQAIRLAALGRGIVVLFDMKTITRTDYQDVLDVLSNNSISDVHFIYDAGTLNKSYTDYVDVLASLISDAKRIFVRASFSISGTSFPFSFSGYHYGENPIYERLLFNKVDEKIDGISLLYSDRGSARIEKQNGGGGIPSPRIDYPLKNDWRFVRNEYVDSSDPKDGEKDELYRLCAQEIMSQDYWLKDLSLWGTQMIELTAKGEKFSINSPQKSTAVRINIHLYTQLHYNSNINEIDTDEDWVD